MELDQESPVILYFASKGYSTLRRTFTQGGFLFVLEILSIKNYLTLTKTILFVLLPD